MIIKRRSLLAGTTAGMAALAAPGILRAQTQTFRLSSWLPRQHTVPYDILDPWIEIVAQSTNNRVQIEILEAPLGPPPAHLGLAQSGEADIVYTLHGYSGQEAFLRSQIGQFSFLGDSFGTAIVFSDIYRNELNASAEHEGVELLGLWTHGPGLLFLNGVDIRTLDDFQQLRVRTPGGYITEMVTELGAENQFLSPGQISDAFTSDQINAATFPWEAAPAFGFADKVTTGLEMPGGIYNATWMLVMNSDAWNRISDRDQQIVQQVSGEVIGLLAGKSWDEADYLGKQRCADIGMTIQRASDELIADFADLASGYEQRWAQAVAAEGFDGDGALDLLRRRTSVQQL